MHINQHYKFPKHILCVVLIVSAFAHKQVSNKNWSDGKLNWENFKKRTDTTRLSALKYVFAYKKEKFPEESVVKIRLKAIGYIDLTNSWINQDHQSTI
jgi:hypothetical protein